MNGTIYTNSVKIKIILLQKPKTTSLNQEAAKYRIAPSLKKKNGMEQSLPSVLLKVSPRRLSLNQRCASATTKEASSSFPRKFIELLGLESRGGGLP